MSAKVKSVLSVVGEAFETAAGYALIAVALYAILFVDMTGGGSLWNSLKHLQGGTQAGLESPNATRVIKVATQPPVERPHEDRMLAVFDEPDRNGISAAVYQSPDSKIGHPSAAFTDTLADPNSGKSWKRSLVGQLRSFTVYGKGDQGGSAESAAGSAPVTSGTAIAAVAGSPAVAPTATESRPGMGTRLSRGALSASGTSRNVR